MNKKTGSCEEIKLSDFNRELSTEELQQALKQLILLHNKLSDSFANVHNVVNRLDKEARFNRPFNV